MRKEIFDLTQREPEGITRPARDNLRIRRLSLIAFLFLGSIFSAPAQNAPAVSVGHQQLSITYADCLARARQALDSEGYQTARGGGNFYWGGKGIHYATIVCDENTDSRVDVHVFVASTSGDGNVPGAERVRLQQRMENPTNVTRSNLCAPFEGVWSTNYTQITFRRSGNSVTGSYQYQGASTLSGTLTGNVLVGESYQPSYPNPRYRRGRFRFVLSADNQSFTGQWWDADGNLGGEWNGKCQTPANGGSG